MNFIKLDWLIFPIKNIEAISADITKAGAAITYFLNVAGFPPVVTEDFYWEEGDIEGTNSPGIRMERRLNELMTILNHYRAGKHND